MEPKISEKAWNPELEKEILKQWDEEKIYAFSPTDDNFTKLSAQDPDGHRCLL